MYEMRKYGDPILTQECSVVTDFDESLATLVKEMFETMYSSQGVGLAAPQIGIPIQLAVVDTSGGSGPEHQITLVNPKIVKRDYWEIGDEGCLSVPGFLEKIHRPAYVKVMAQDIKGEWHLYEGRDLLARAFCHEIDHLHGTLFFDHLSGLKRDRIKSKIKKLRKEGNW